MSGRRGRRRASEIPNKLKRQEVYAKERAEKHGAKIERKRKRKREAAELGDAAVPLVPTTLETSRKTDETWVDATDKEVAFDESMDEFSPYFAGERVLILQFCKYCLLLVSYRPQRLF
jgi:hypothetical protein